MGPSPRVHRKYSSTALGRKISTARNSFPVPIPFPAFPGFRNNVARLNLCSEIIKDNKIEEFKPSYAKRKKKLVTKTMLAGLQATLEFMREHGAGIAIHWFCDSSFAIHG